MPQGMASLSLRQLNHDALQGTVEDVMQEVNATRIRQCSLTRSASSVAIGTCRT